MSYIAGAASWYVAKLPGLGCASFLHQCCNVDSPTAQGFGSVVKARSDKRLCKGSPYRVGGLRCQNFGSGVVQKGVPDRTRGRGTVVNYV
jgi:hypothetical protein